jgi:hypothetical protein
MRNGFDYMPSFSFTAGYEFEASLQVSAVLYLFSHVFFSISRYIMRGFLAGLLPLARSLPFFIIVMLDMALTMRLCCRAPTTSARCSHPPSLPQVRVRAQTAMLNPITTSIPPQHTHLPPLPHTPTLSPRRTPPIPRHHTYPLPHRTRTHPSPHQ